MRKLTGRFSDAEYSLLKQFKFRHLDPSQERWGELSRYYAGIVPRLPQGAKALVSAEWHYNASDPRCPHDSWIRSIAINSDSYDSEIQNLQIRLLGAFHDRIIFFEYFDVTDCFIQGQLVEASSRNLDWLYDEVHLCDSGLVEHLIEFEACVIRVECTDFTCTHTLIEGS